MTPIIIAASAVTIVMAIHGVQIQLRRIANSLELVDYEETKTQKDES